MPARTSALASPLVHPVAFQIGNTAIYWYGIFIAVGILLGLWSASRRARLDKLPGETIADLGVVLILGSLLGARLFFVVSYWDDFKGQPWSQLFAIRGGGLVFYGGLIGGTLSCIAWCLWKKVPMWRVGDALAPSVALCHALGRIGCLMTGCCYGSPTDLPWAIHFPAEHATRGTAVHPSQLYESGLNLLLYLGLAWLYRRKKFDGQVFATYLICYAVLRSFVELFRGDYPADQLTGFATPAHLVSIGILAAGAVLWWRLPRRLGAK